MNLHSKQKGFSLVELTIVVVILGVLATFAVPRFRTSVEKTKASEGITYLHQLQSQQARFLVTHGRYAQSKHEFGTTLGETMRIPHFFATSAFSSSNWEQRWSTKLTRNGASSGFGRYTIAWNQDGFVASSSTIPSALMATGTGGTGGSSHASGDSSHGFSSSGSSKKEGHSDHGDYKPKD